jgi:hypothetical protein
MKRVEFGAKRPSEPEGRNLDAWVQGGTPDAREPTKRLTIDVSISLHKRIKSQCALENLIMADEIRELLDRRFPPKSEQGPPS